MNEEKTDIIPENENRDTNVDYAMELNVAEERIKELEKELADANAKADQSSKSNLMYYRQVQVLKAALELLRTELNITDATFYSALLVGSREEIDIDSLLYQLSK